MGLASIPRWSASSGSTRTACWPWCTAAATTIRACRISRRWGSGTRECQTAASRSGGLGGWRTNATTPSTRNVIVNLGNSQSLAVRSGRHSPLVFDDPAASAARARRAEKQVLAGLSQRGPPRTPRSSSWRRRLQNATESSDFVRQATASYRTTVDYGRWRRTGRQPPARRGAHCRGNADAPVLRHLSGQLVRHARAAGRSSQPAADVHRRRGARLHGRPQAHRPCRRSGRHDLHGVRPPGRREREPREPITARRRRCLSSARVSRAVSTGSLPA